MNATRERTTSIFAVSGIRNTKYAINIVNITTRYNMCFQLMWQVWFNEYNTHPIIIFIKMI
jgi:hypothetical protein